MAKLTGAQLLVKCLEEQGVEYIFGIPGAKIDSVFDALLDSNIQVIVCRHEQNAVFIAEAYGRLTGNPGVVLVTSGPGITNLVTGLLTATTEGDPVVALGGNAPRIMRNMRSHQSANNELITKGVTKSTTRVEITDCIPEVVENAFRSAIAPIAGASFISLPQDVLTATTERQPIKKGPIAHYGVALDETIKLAAELVNQAKHPILLLGQEASRPENCHAIRELLKMHRFPVISTYQAAGVIPRSFMDCFLGRVGLFRNQAGDIALDESDLVLAIGFNTVEYDPEIWNPSDNKIVINISYVPCYIHGCYHPRAELLGDIAANIHALCSHLTKRNWMNLSQKVLDSNEQHLKKIASGKSLAGFPIHPLRFIYELNQVVDEETTICCDIGTVYIWLARYFYTHRPHQLLFSNGQQTLGVGLPWAIGCNYARPGKKVVSISGDGGFLFSAMELETAVREGLHFVHFVWRDGTYNMVLEQELAKYHRKSAVDIGKVNIPDFAKSFGAVGFELTHADQFNELYQEAMRSKKPVLIDVPIDYSHNKQLFTSLDPDTGH